MVEQALAHLVHRAIHAHVGRLHVGVAVAARPEARLPRRLYALAHVRAGLAQALVAQLVARLTELASTRGDSTWMSMR